MEMHIYQSCLVLRKLCVLRHPKEAHYARRLFAQQLSNLWKGRFTKGDVR